MFNGFRSDEERVQLPAGLLADIVPAITSLAELKVTLHLFWRLAAQVGQPRLLSYPELAADPVLAASLTAGRNPRPAKEWLREGLELAVARGTLLQLTVQPEGGEAELWYMVHTPFNARWLEQVSGDGAAAPEQKLASVEWLALLRAEREAALSRAAGEDTDASLEVERIRVTRRRAGIFELYEQNIGVITPLLAEQLAEAERTYPSAWIEDAFTEAVSYNKRNWKYVSRILENWAAKGKDDGTSGQNPGRALDPDKYLTGKYAHLFQRE
ncbi:MAG: DnaD domain-containing protein [Chloroflexia bacterium]